MASRPGALGASPGPESSGTAGGGRSAHAAPEEAQGAKHGTPLVQLPRDWGPPTGRGPAPPGRSKPDPGRCRSVQDREDLDYESPERLGEGRKTLLQLLQLLLTPLEILEHLGP